MKRIGLALLGILLAAQAVAGTWTPNNFLYKPSLGASGESEKTLYDSGLNRVDVRLGNEKWLNDSAYGGNLATAISAVDSNPAILRVPTGNFSISADLTTPANLTLKLEQGAVISVPTGKTLTINGCKWEPKNDPSR